MNKLENTLEHKAKFFALYWGQEVLRSSIWDKWENQPSKKIMNGTFSLGEREQYLLLKPLSMISDEDIQQVYVSGATAEKYDVNEYGLCPKGGGGWPQRHGYTRENIDYLRSRSYALPWMNLSIEDLQSYGWIKLIEE